MGKAVVQSAFRHIPNSLATSQFFTQALQLGLLDEQLRRHTEILGKQVVDGAGTYISHLRQLFNAQVSADIGLNLSQEAGKTAIIGV